MIELIQKTIELEGSEVNYYVKRHRNSRGINLLVDKDRGFRVVASQWASQNDILNAIEKNKEWILKNVKYFDSLPKEKRELGHGETVNYLGLPYVLEIAGAKKNSLEINETTILLNKKNSTKTINEVFNKLLKEKAKEFLTKKTNEFAFDFGVDINNIVIKDQKTCWGSCSPSKNINLNWRLIMEPLRVIDYVIVHELCHLAHLNHSKRFWDLVEKRMPEYKQHEKWLKKNRPKLRFG